MVSPRDRVCWFEHTIGLNVPEFGRTSGNWLISKKCLPRLHWLQLSEVELT